MSEQPIIDRTGRLDLLAQDGLGQLADRLGSHFGIGLRAFLQPVINRFVKENVDRTRMPVTPEAIAERMGILQRQNRKRGKG